MDFERFRRVWTRVDGLEMHSFCFDRSESARCPGGGSGKRLRALWAYMIPTASVLTADFRVYVPDLPGFGDSGKPEEILNVPQLADWLISSIAVRPMESTPWETNIIRISSKVPAATG